MWAPGNAAMPGMGGSSNAGIAVTRPTEAKQFPVWRQPDGAPVSCLEKIKVLNENLAEIEQMAQDAFEDALLMGCDERQVREVLGRMVERLHNPYRKDR